jgi:hypothetical protein
MDVDGVALMLYNAKGSLADVYDAVGNKDRDVGPHRSAPWMEEKSFVQQLGLVPRFDVSASASLENFEGSEAGENESEELRGVSETAP